MFFSNGFNADNDQLSFDSGLCCEDESLAIQSAKDEADINTIVRRFGLTGELPGDFQMPQSGDFTNIPDFHSAMNRVRQAEEAFMELPGEIRARFMNDPAAVMEFLNDDKNREEAVKLGLVAKPKEVTRDVVKAVDELAAKIVGSGEKKS